MGRWYLEVCLEKEIRSVVEAPFPGLFKRSSVRKGDEQQVCIKKINWQANSCSTYLSLIHKVNTRLITLAASSNLSFFSKPFAPMTSSPRRLASPSPICTSPRPTLAACSSSAWIAKTRRDFPARYKHGIVHAPKPA